MKFPLMLNIMKISTYLVKYTNILSELGAYFTDRHITNYIIDKGIGGKLAC